MSTSTAETGRWQLIDQLFDGALDRPPGERAAWLEAACKGDAELYSAVNRLLTAHRRSEGMLDRPLSITLSAEPREVIGTALEGKYRIDRELGRGGMAVVFLAHEHKHSRPVVLKVLRPGMATSGDIAERFQREVRIIAQLVHPHVIGLIDSGEAAGLLYYVMHYVDGETLRTRLQREKVLSPGEAVILLRDIAAALSYAHQRGVVHRDLKPENVLCAGTHAYLMDFGIAKLLEPVADAETTAEWAIIGTPGYMAPEQHVPGQEIDHRTDLYSFGLIAREILTGRGPLLAGQRMAELQNQFDEGPAVPPALNAIINHCLKTDPAERPESAERIQQQLARYRPSGAMVQAAAPLPAKRKTKTWVLAASVGVLATLGVWFASREKPRPVLPSPIAVAGFTNQTGDSTLDILGRMAGDWVTQGLQETGLVSVVPWPVSLLATEDYGRSGHQESMVEHVRKETGAGTVVTGSYYLVGDSLQFRAEATDAAQARLLGAPAPITVSRDSAMVAIREIRERLMGAVGMFTNELIGGSGAGELSRRPPIFAAYVAFDEGIRNSRAQDYKASAASFARAYQLDTTFTAALLYQANANWNEGQFGTMDSALTKARSRLNQLSQALRYWLEFQEANLAGRGDLALAAGRARAQAAPGAMAWYSLAVVALRVGRVEEAVDALTRVDPDRSEMRGWSPYWTQLAHARHLSGDYVRELEAARGLRARYPDRRVGEVLEARALAVLGRLTELDSMLDADASLPPTTYWSQGAAMVMAGEELLAHGRKEEGRRYLARGVNWLKAELAIHPEDRSHRYWLGSALYDLNRWSESAAIFQQLAKESPRADYTWLAAVALLRTGADSATIAPYLRPPADRERGDYSMFQARMALIRGDREAAISLFSDGLRYGVDGVPWLHASAVRDMEMLGELRTRMPAGILPTSEQ